MYIEDMNYRGLILEELTEMKTPKGIVTAILLKRPELNTVQVGRLRRAMDDLMIEGVIGYTTSREKIGILDKQPNK